MPNNVVEIDGKAAKNSKKKAQQAAKREMRQEQVMIAPKKIKLTEEGAAIDFTLYDGKTEPKLCSVKIEEPVHPDLITKLNQLLPTAIDAIGLDDKMWREGSVTGLTIKGDSEVTGCTISIRALIGELTVPLTTPFLSESSGLADVVRLEDVRSEIELCLLGKREQSAWIQPSLLIGQDAEIVEDDDQYAYREDDEWEEQA